MPRSRSPFADRPFGFIDELASALGHGPDTSAVDLQAHPHWAIASWEHTPALATTRDHPFNTLVLQFGGGTHVERLRRGITTHVEARVGGVTTCPQGEDIEFHVHETVKVFHLYFDQAYLAEVVGAEDAARVGPVPEVFCGQDTPIQALMEAMRTQVHAGTWTSPVGALSLEHTVRATVAQIAHGVAYARPPRATRIASRRMLQIQAYVDAQLDGPLTVRELAAQVGLTLEHFGRSFKAEMGVSPQAWIHGRRIARARDLLRNSVLPVAEVAARTGFSSPAHLSRSFRKAVGTTPGEFRRQQVA